MNQNIQNSVADIIQTVGNFKEGMKRIQNVLTKEIELFDNILKLLSNNDEYEEKLVANVIIEKNADKKMENKEKINNYINPCNRMLTRLIEEWNMHYESPVLIEEYFINIDLDDIRDWARTMHESNTIHIITGIIRASGNKDKFHQREWLCRCTKSTSAKSDTFCLITSEDAP